MLAFKALLAKNVYGDLSGPVVQPAVSSHCWEIGDVQQNIRAGASRIDQQALCSIVLHRNLITSAECGKVAECSKGSRMQHG